MKEKILIIDDDKKLNDLLTQYLSKYGFKVVTDTHPLNAFKHIHEFQPNLILLDVMLPEMDGFEVCKKIRQESSIPIIMLTARGEVTDRVVGLEIGAVDYIPKPFEPREIVARIQAVLRRSHHTTLDILKFKDLEIDLKTHTVLKDGEAIDLTTMEFDILALFARHPGQVLSRDQIIEHIKGEEFDAFNRSVDILISRLRHKLGDNPKNPQILKTIWGRGYKFVNKEG